MSCDNHDTVISNDPQRDVMTHETKTNEFDGRMGRYLVP